MVEYIPVASSTDLSDVETTTFLMTLNDSLKGKGINITLSSLDDAVSNAVRHYRKLYPKKAEVIPVMQDWVGTITRRQQGVLVLGLRGPDGMPKEHPSKNAIRSLRACAMNNGRTGIPMPLGMVYPDDSFMRMDLIADNDRWKTECVKPFFSCVDQYNLHFYQHFLHAAAVLGFNHPEPNVRNNWNQMYKMGCDKIHMIPETEAQFKYRLRDGVRDEDTPFEPSS